MKRERAAATYSQDDDDDGYTVLAEDGDDDYDSPTTPCFIYPQQSTDISTYVLFKTLLFRASKGITAWRGNVKYQESVFAARAVTLSTLDDLDLQQVSYISSTSFQVLPEEMNILGVTPLDDVLECTKVANKSATKEALVLRLQPAGKSYFYSTDS